MRNVTLMTACIASAIAWTASSANADCGHKSAKLASGKPDIVDTAVAAGSFNTLVEAVKAAGLVDTLKSPGPFTVFAPTDEAFAKLPKGTINELLANPDRLAAILKFHVVPGRVRANDVVRLNSARTALGQSISIDTNRGVRVSNANVIKTDIETANGIIHVIDSVMIPQNDIIETARAAGSFKTLLAALEAAQLTDALRGTGPVTVFAPTDEAFAKLPKGTVESLLQDIPTLTSILTYHVVPGKILAKDVVKLESASTLQGETLMIDASSGVMVNASRVIKTDIGATNGVIHVIDEVLLPDYGKRAETMSPAQTLIGKAIERGATLFNDGHHGACAAVYEVAAMGLLSNEDLSNHNRRTLQTALADAGRTHDESKSAWIMRHALDEVYASISQ